MPIPAHAIPFGTTDENIRLITRSAFDYMEGWLTGDARRMRRALHPDLAERTLVIDAETGTPTNELYGINAAQLVCYTEDGGATQWSDTPYNTEAGREKAEVKILEVYRNIAVARIWSEAFVEYLQLGDFGPAGWKIVNILNVKTKGTAPFEEFKQFDFDYWVVDDTAEKENP